MTMVRQYSHVQLAKMTQLERTKSNRYCRNNVGETSLSTELMVEMTRRKIIVS
jgi:hypothetical protein